MASPSRDEQRRAFLELVDEVGHFDGPVVACSRHVLAVSEEAAQAARLFYGAMIGEDREKAASRIARLAARFEELRALECRDEPHRRRAGGG